MATTGRRMAKKIFTAEAIAARPRRDLGSLRVPPFVAFLAFSLLFGLTLLSLHWRERDLQEAAARVAGEADAITKAAAESTPEPV